ncbi:hypothetical protein TRFO_35796 [Tritrichomonas foetus]|uniref:Myb-like DNA-binding domain containing protein n=1 Tax=Tritrichomonas foetus TaxID=1144522 RepID=A0A1J4JK08_9EUKA|nr:hypothetical protein TRFO_35796 [Tritrichomonas foetus]|eukprot:OHS97893.1 hypothetical protein TRFO_35796 [Tritrichomonas foetus]
MQPKKRNTWSIDLPANCTSVHQDHLNKVCKCRRRVFSTEEDMLLAELVSVQKCQNWFEVAKRLPGRSVRQCRDRWTNYLCPTNKFEPWTMDEDLKIVKLVNEIGTKWGKISELMPGRSDNTVKNRWYSGLKKNCTVSSRGKYYLKTTYSNNNSQSSSVKQASSNNSSSSNSSSSNNSALDDQSNSRGDSSQSNSSSISGSSASGLNEKKHSFYSCIIPEMKNFPSNSDSKNGINLVNVPSGIYNGFCNNIFGNFTKYGNNDYPVDPKFYDMSFDEIEEQENRTKKPNLEITAEESDDNFWDQKLFSQVTELFQDPFYQSGIAEEW